ncbi:MAG: Uma2 family endonuclease [Candidatus Parabeggiatoa sp. nov. 3]|jgi:Uma2 family endonuclease|nr:MAG: Uma2 family endonuclease [Gammaproteobacteria bacterium]RKZ67164.1 MAG: Uma2 family endonuclease [Gammaproteobacteria bacterium]RKZ89732.1 MAG: Uma2 family endonuclease [Gammaproteobacteria bacterium]HEW97355.1 Uma2 family endonuclease [Beggiatoa sp.]
MSKVALKIQDDVVLHPTQEAWVTQTAQVKPFPITVPLPTEDDLPSCDGVPMETQRHKMQMDLLIESLDTWLAQRQDGYVGGNMFVYFSTKQVRNQDFRGPDVFVVLDVPKRERKSWVVWEENGKTPDVVIELLSDSTRETDKTEKKRIYQNQLRVPEYFWYDPFNPDDLAGFTLHSGVYEPLAPDAQNRLISQRLGLTLVRWQGVYRDVETVWLRWATLEGILLPTAREAAEQAEQKAEQAEQRATRLAEKLRAMGINPDEI